MWSLKYLPIRTKFVRLPFVGSLVLIVPLMLYAMDLRSERRALARIEQENLAKVGILSDLFAQLSSNHVRIFTILSSAIEFLDEEEIYENGKNSLYKIDSISKKISLLTESYTFNGEEQRHLSILIALLNEYRKTAVSSIDMASVDVKLANKFMIKSNEKYKYLNDHFIVLLDIARKNVQNLMFKTGREAERKTTIFSIVIAVALFLLIIMSRKVASTLEAAKEAAEVANHAKSALLADMAQTNTQLHDSLEQLEQAYRDLAHSQEKLVRAEKMAAFGRLTAGIAHEVSTPLSASMTTLVLAQRLVKEYKKSLGDPEVSERDYQEIGAEMDKHLSNVHQWLEKAAGYIQGLKVHSRSLQRGKEGYFSILQVIDDTQQLVSHQLRLSECAVTISCVSPQLTLYGDPGKLGQALTNLIANAIDAYKEASKGSGEIRIEINENKDIVEIRVSDQGCGIPPENIEKIFNEFFSTKLLGKGTGLGLAISRDIIANFFGGAMSVESRPGRGSTFSLRLPRRWRREEQSVSSVPNWHASHPLQAGDAIAVDTVG